MIGSELLLALLLLVNLGAALVRAAQGPTAADRMLAALLFGSTGVGILVLLAVIQQTPALIDVALTLALLAAISGIAFAQRAWSQAVLGRRRGTASKTEDGDAA
ncbi:MAG: monovalent cation/H+ antiporter complex subunit F [Trichlorobacter sp.]|uniref:monovalent cation/H+ antiporter complex subunit F n=1 Tax=Trichlorobacter sp. TaxID=2911007 RepID=UPI0025661675|nr:monovalent cation/H+ antiporter complex subunit F [Trichlorobacter sp.]MDK9719024.1 monovalent cation/H+ antiporter complex subunit F [Trichlorobacter sp.]